VNFWKLAVQKPQILSQNSTISINVNGDKTLPDWSASLATLANLKR
jgi:hypothetical protein